MYEHRLIPSTYQKACQFSIDSTAAEQIDSQIAGEIRCQSLRVSCDFSKTEARRP